MLLATTPWNIVDAIPALGGLSYAATGLAVTGFTLVWTRSRSEQDDESSNLIVRHAIGELLLASLILGVASFEWTILAGESDRELLRPEAAAAFAGAGLILGSIQVIAGLCYLVIEFEHRSPTQGRRMSLVPLCELGYLAYAGVSAFFVAWVSTDVLWLGISGWPRPSGPWVGQVIPVASAILAIGALAPQRFVERSLVAASFQSVAWRAATRPHAWNATGLVASLSGLGFVYTVFIGTDDSSLARPGSWELSLGTGLYIAALGAVCVGTICASIVQGWIIQKHLTHSDLPDSFR